MNCIHFKDTPLFYHLESEDDNLDNIPAKRYEVKDGKVVLNNKTEIIDRTYIIKYLFDKEITIDHFDIAESALNFALYNARNEIFDLC